MGFVGGQELVAILIVALILFGPKKLPELARSFGKAMAEFNKAKNEFSQDGFKKLIEDEIAVKPEPPKKSEPKPEENPAEQQSHTPQSGVEAFEEQSDENV